MKNKRKTLPWDPEASAADNARMHLPELAGQFFAAGRKAARKKSKTKDLHKFRLQVKRFRYTLELFDPLYGPALGKRLASLRRLQQALGGLNDCVMTRELVLEAAGGKSSGVEDLLAQLDKKAESRKAKFLGIWNDVFDAPGEEQQWVRYLRAYAGRGGVPAGAETGPSAEGD